MKGFPTRAPAELEDRPRAQQWMVDTLWSEQAVGIVGGEPKCGKSLLALDLAVAVATGAPCLRRYRPTGSGTVLLFAAEDAGHRVRKRLQATFVSVPIITARSCSAKNPTRSSLRRSESWRAWT